MDAKSRRRRLTKQAALRGYEEADSVLKQEAAVERGAVGSTKKECHVVPVQCSFFCVLPSFAKASPKPGLAPKMILAQAGGFAARFPDDSSGERLQETNLLQMCRCRVGKCCEAALPDYVPLLCGRRGAVQIRQVLHSWPERLLVLLAAFFESCLDERVLARESCVPGFLADPVEPPAPMVEPLWLR